MTNETFNYFDLPIGESPEPTPVSEQRRALARALPASGGPPARLDAAEAAEKESATVPVFSAIYSPF